MIIIREELSDESLFYDFTPVSMISDRGDFCFRGWMNSLSAGPLRLSGSGARADSSLRERPVPGIVAVSLQRENRRGEKVRSIAVRRKPPDA